MNGDSVGQQLQEADLIIDDFFKLTIADITALITNNEKTNALQSHSAGVNSSIRDLKIC